MNLDDDPWSKNLLRKPGEALLDQCAPPDGCPDYGAVMLWHNDLAGLSLEARRQKFLVVRRPVAGMSHASRIKSRSLIVLSS